MIIYKIVNIKTVINVPLLHETVWNAKVITIQIRATEETGTCK